MGHIEVLCEIYQQNAEDLGLINWRRKPSPDRLDDEPTVTEQHDDTEPTITHQQVVEWVRVSVAAVAVEALQVLQRHLTAAEPRTDQPPDVRD